MVHRLLLRSQWPEDNRIQCPLCLLLKVEKILAGSRLEMTGDLISRKKVCKRASGI